MWIRGRELTGEQPPGTRRYVRRGCPALRSRPHPIQVIDRAPSTAWVEGTQRRQHLHRLRRSV